MLAPSGNSATQALYYYYTYFQIYLFLVYEIVNNDILPTVGKLNWKDISGSSPLVNLLFMKIF